MNRSKVPCLNTVPFTEEPATADGGHGGEEKRNSIQYRLSELERWSRNLDSDMKDAKETLTEIKTAIGMVKWGIGVVILMASMVIHILFRTMS